MGSLPEGPVKVQTLLVGGTGLGGHSALGGCVRPVRGCISHPYVSSLCVPAGSASMSSPAWTNRRSDGGSTGVPRPAAAPGSTGGVGPPPAPPPAYLNKALLQTATRLLLCRGSAPTFSCPPHSTSPVTVPEAQCVSLARNLPWPQAPPSQLPPPRRAPSGPPPWPRSRILLSPARWPVARLPPGWPLAECPSWAAAAQPQSPLL